MKIKLSCSVFQKNKNEKTFARSKKKFFGQILQVVANLDINLKSFIFILFNFNSFLSKIFSILKIPLGHGLFKLITVSKTTVIN